MQLSGLITTFIFITADKRPFEAHFIILTHQNSLNLIIYHADTKPLMEQKMLPQLLQRVPKSMHGRAERYQSEKSSYNFIVGRLLLMHGLRNLGLDDSLMHLKIDENGKPMVPDAHFNISHTDHQVVCAFANEGVLGVDLETIKEIDFTDFDSMFTSNEWRYIKSAENPLKSFYWFWTRKESIIKALGKNLNYLHQIELDVSIDHFIDENQIWYLKDLDFMDGYVGAICSKRKINNIDLLHVNL